jgi:hypothetical protein
LNYFSTSRSFRALCLDNGPGWQLRPRFAAGRALGYGKLFRRDDADAHGKSYALLYGSDASDLALTYDGGSSELVTLSTWWGDRQLARAGDRAP